MVESVAIRRFLVTNDDGVDAPGIAALAAVARRHGEAVTVAPSGPFSGCGHRVTTSEPIGVTRRAADCFVVEGTPADCVRLALHHLVSEVAWVVSGINAGGNLGTDVHHSGTVAAVREAVIHGVPGIAFSQYIARGRPVDWERARAWAGRAVTQLVELPWQPGTFWNVNFPHLEPGAAEPALVFCPLDPSPLPLRYRLEGDRAHYAGDYHGRARRTGHDVDVCFRGDIAVSLIRVAHGGDLAVDRATGEGAVD